jgi:ATP-dependent DNA helicase RecG
VKTVENGYQGALMAPTEILASQHYESFQRQLTPFGIRIGFLSGRLTKKKRETMYAARSLLMRWILSSVRMP